MSDNLKVRSFSVTHNPRDGVTDDDVKLFVNWVKKKCTYYYVITEKDDHERHIHAGLFLKAAVTKSNLCTMLLRLFKELDVSEKAVLRDGIKFQYNNDWIESYLAKGDSTVQIAENLPEAQHLEAYFKEIPAPKKRGPAATDPYYANLEKLWYEHKRPIEECNPSNIRNFLMAMMNDERKIKVIADNRKIFSISCALSRYINKERSWNVEPEPFHQDV